MAELKVICGSTQTVIRTEPGGRVSDILRAHGFRSFLPAAGGESAANVP